MRESVLRLIEICEACGVSYIPRNGEICECEEPKVNEWDGIGWRPEVELQNDE